MLAPERRIDQVLQRVEPRRPPLQQDVAALAGHGDPRPVFDRLHRNLESQPHGGSHVTQEGRHPRFEIVSHSPLPLPAAGPPLARPCGRVGSLRARNMLRRTFCGADSYPLRGPALRARRSAAGRRSAGGRTVRTFGGPMIRFVATCCPMPKTLLVSQ